MESSCFIAEQVHGLLRIVDRVVDLFGLELVVLDQCMVRPLGEQKRGQMEGVDDRYLCQFPAFRRVAQDPADMLQIVLNHIMTT